MFLLPQISIWAKWVCSQGAPGKCSGKQLLTERKNCFKQSFVSSWVNSPSVLHMEDTSDIWWNPAKIEYFKGRFPAKKKGDNNVLLDALTLFSIQLFLYWLLPGIFKSFFYLLDIFKSFSTCSLKMLKEHLDICVYYNSLDMILFLFLYVLL